ncbi:MAG: glycoside hydrolase family 31 protein [Clostridia bacterium]|nr:glycoside hydrolase family 31 protein [Clostridia bacterium]
MKRFEISCNPVAKEQTIVGHGYRLSVLSPTILRVELSKTNTFENRPSQMVFCRDFCATKFTSSENATSIIIETSCNIFSFSKSTKKVQVLAKEDNEDERGNTEQIFAPRKLTKRGNLGGTRRTIDFKMGAVPLGKGLMSKGGVTVVDDSKNFVINPDGTLTPRVLKTKDFYVFAFDKYYADGLTDYFKLTGFPPILPKYALGNWWSRYYPYSETSYLALMDKFAEKRIPLSVATIDMDWHWVKEVPKEFGSGWTGYSWNTGLFPDYKRFLNELKARGLAITLNIHPATGVRAFEDMYEDMAKAMGVDPDTKQNIEFDLSNPKFLDAYFKVLHNPYEKDGVDFWWIDWQQGNKSTVKGLDPLWLLNHYHTLDINRGEKNGLILSRYAKLGSHRYPLGFSGDCIMAWKSLKFQPYFTSTASNVGYTWWSHDIGGHVFGRSDDELYLRWLQWGVFSPINRLHSSNGAFMGKEPWLYRKDVEEYAESFLRLRHKMLPYLYTSNVLTAMNGEPLLSPMYYNLTADDDLKLAYKSKASYFFGSQLIAAPVTAKLKPKFNRAGVKFYMPTGEWTDIFTAQKYSGGKNVKLFRKLDSIPVLAKSGAIIPMLKDENSNKQSFENIEVWVYKGFGSYTMFDDNKASVSFESALTNDGLAFNISAPNGKLVTKSIKIIFKDIVSAEIMLDGVAFRSGNSVDVIPNTEHKIELNNIKTAEPKEYLKEVEDLLQDYHIFTPTRRIIFAMIRKTKNRDEAYKLVRRMLLRKDVKGALLEILGLEK